MEKAPEGRLHEIEERKLFYFYLKNQLENVCDFGYFAGLQHFVTHSILPIETRVEKLLGCIILLFYR
jgi:hypothetical protein